MDRQENGTSKGAGSEHKAGLGSQIGQLGDTARQLISEARDAVNGLRGTLDISGRIERHPYAMLAGAVGLGYLLGGGLLSGLTFRLVRLGVKVAAVPLLKSQLLGLVESALSQAASDRGPQRTAQSGIA